MRLLLDESVPAKLAFVTVDKNLEYQQDLSKLPIAVVVLDAPSSELSTLQRLVPNLEQALSALPPRTLVRVRAVA